MSRNKEKLDHVAREIGKGLLFYSILSALKRPAFDYMDKHGKCAAKGSFFFSCQVTPQEGR